MIRPHRRLAFAVGLILALAAVEARACSCSPTSIPSAEQMIAIAPVIFSGIARESRMTGPREIETVFEVTEALHGTTVGSRVTVRHQAPVPGSCGIAFSVGETHTLGAHRANGGPALAANLCTTWMFNVDGGDRLIEALRRLKPATPRR